MSMTGGQRRDVAGDKDAAQDQLRIETDPERLDLELIYRFLSQESSWALGISRDVVERSIRNSLCFGGFLGRDQVAFARVITDQATFANLVDVFVLPAWRGRGLSKQLMASVMGHPQLQGLRRFTLATGDAHGLYAQFGFATPLRPASLMERYFPNLYRSGHCAPLASEQGR